MIDQLQVRPLQIPFRQSFKHAAAERRVTQSIWVEVGSTDGTRGYGEGCPREYVTGETVASALEYVRSIAGEVRQLADLEGLKAWVGEHEHQIDAHPAAWCAVELALLDFTARKSNQSVEALLGLASITGPFQYSAVLGAEPVEVFRGQWERYRHMGFRHLKVKLSGTEEDFDRAAVLRADADRIDSLRFDANNLWSSPAPAIAHLKQMAVPFQAVEEPLRPGDYEGLRIVAQACGGRIILDESLLRVRQLEGLREDAATWICNLRVSKLGGLLRSLGVMAKAQSMGIPMIVGCQVGETSLFTRAGLTLAQVCLGRGLLMQEGAFGTLLLASDPVEPNLKFGAGGILDVAAPNLAEAAGFGLRPVAIEREAP